jgi:protein SCO1/2
MQLKYSRAVYCCAAIILLLIACHSASSEKDQLPYYISADFTPQWIDAKNADTIHSIPDFSFIDQQGETITRKTFDGKITVVDFFFTTCPGICKKLTSHMAQVQEAFKNDKDVLLLSHSVTPERDSVPVLSAYAKAHGAIAGKWMLVTGDRSAVYTIARQSYFADEDLGIQQDSTTFLHTENILLIDGHHHIRGVYKGTIPLEINDLITDIKKLQQEE